MAATLFPHASSDFALSDDGLPTLTSEEQAKVEEDVLAAYEAASRKGEMETEGEQAEPLLLNRSLHAHFLFGGLKHLATKFQCLDSSRPWIVYWITHGLALLGKELSQTERDNVVSFLKACEGEKGGYGGGPGQEPHLATTYAAVLALLTLGTEKAYQSIDRPKLVQFLRGVKQSDGGFRVSSDGEVDVRGAYLAAAVASATDIINVPGLFDATPEWIVSCQTYEGGYGASRGCEAHGGYTFCAVAGLCLLGHPRLVHIPSLQRWLSCRQLPLEGGFQGRSNKLVDVCYSFWQAACFPIIRTIIRETQSGKEPLGVGFDSERLQHYVLAVAQNHRIGGFCDKPGKSPDYYHSCYALSGLSIAQWSDAGPDQEPNVIGPPQNGLEETHPLLNIRLDLEQRAREYFSALPSVS